MINDKDALIDYDEQILNRLPEEEAELLRMYRKLSEEDKDKFFEIIRNKIKEVER